MKALHWGIVTSFSPKFALAPPPPGPPQGPSRLGHARRGRSEPAKTDLLQSCPSSGRPEGLEQRLLQGRLSLRAQDPARSSPPSALSPSADPEQRTAACEVPSHPPATSEARPLPPQGVLPKKVRHLHQNVKKGRWPAALG